MRPYKTNSVFRKTPRANIPVLNYLQYFMDYSGSFTKHFCEFCLLLLSQVYSGKYRARLTLSEHSQLYCQACLEQPEWTQWHRTGLYYGQDQPADWERQQQSLGGFCTTGKGAAELVQLELEQMQSHTVLPKYCTFWLCKFCKQPAVTLPALQLPDYR